VIELLAKDHRNGVVLSVNSRTVITKKRKCYTLTLLVDVWSLPEVMQQQQQLTTNFGVTLGWREEANAEDNMKLSVQAWCMIQRYRLDF
jgi:hypothetical protein